MKAIGGRKWLTKMAAHHVAKKIIENEESEGVKMAGANISESNGGINISWRGEISNRR
jgi:hypothetical protein